MEEDCRITSHNTFTENDELLVLNMRIKILNIFGRIVMKCTKNDIAFSRLPCSFSHAAKFSEILR